MKIKILQQDLLPVLQAVSRSVGVRSTLPVLANILIRTENNRLKLSATNLEVGIIKTVNTEVYEEGELTVPAKTFLDIIASLTGETLEIESKSEQLKISTQKFNATLNCIPANEFPVIPISSDKPILVNSTVLLNTLPLITFSAASDDGRPVLTGILTEIKKDSLEFVATDGFRLAHKHTKINPDTTKVDLKEKNNLRVLIPRRTFEEVARLISEDSSGEENIEISTSENQNQMVFKIGDTQLSSRLIEGQFPVWEKIVPQKFENRTIIDRVELLKACKLAAVFSRSEANIIKISAFEKKIVLSSEAKEVGGQETQLEADTEGSEISIAFNSKYLIDILSALSCLQVSIEFSGNLSPALVKPIGEEGLEYVIMPIRLS